MKILHKLHCFQCLWKSKLESRIRIHSKFRQFSSTNPSSSEESQSDTPVPVYKNLIIESLQNVTLIGINRPEKRNCIDPHTASELTSAIEAFEADSSSPAAVLHGKGGTFCSGFDLEWLSQQGGQNEGFSIDKLFLKKNSGQGPMGPSRRLCFSKPVIASISGYAVAGGLELALMCDLRVVEDTAVLGVFCRRFGVPLIDSGTVRLPHLIGLSRALDLILTGRAVSGKEAFDMGLANRVTQTGTALGKAVQLAIGLTKYPQECLNRDRISAYSAMYNSQSFQEAVEFELSHGLQIIEQESIPGSQKFFQEGIGKHGSFNLEKYKPRMLPKKKGKTDDETEIE